MKISKKLIIPIFATTLLVVMNYPAYASKQVEYSQSGFVTSVVDEDNVAINNHTYHINRKVMSPDSLKALIPGKRVEYKLDGPPENSNARIISVEPHKQK